MKKSIQVLSECILSFRDALLLLSTAFLDAVLPTGLKKRELFTRIHMHNSVLSN